MQIHIVEMLRWGDRENHSYVLGAYTSKGRAELAGDIEKSWRGGKYEWEITSVELDNIKKEKQDWHNKCIAKQ